MNFTATNDRNVRLYALLPYFEDLCDDETKDSLFLQELLKHQDAIAAVAKPLGDEPTDKPDHLLQNDAFLLKLGLAGELLTGENAEDFVNNLQQEAIENPERFLAMLKQWGF